MAHSPDYLAAPLHRLSAHHGHNCEIELTSDTTARAIWSMTDRLFMSVGAPFAQMTGYGYYHEIYEKTNGRCRIKMLRLSRIRVEVI